MGFHTRHCSLSANTLAEITGGFSDNLLTSVVRAWDMTGDIDRTAGGEPSRKKRILTAAAMNTAVAASCH
jgi:phosphopantothenoylcysteine decarboxylase